MLRLIQSSALAVIVAGSAIVPLPASAQTLELDLGRGGPELRVRDPNRCDPRYEDCYRGERSMRRMCTEDRALDKAERMGLDRVRVVSAGRRTIEVRGRTEDGDRARITFGRQPNCPVLD
ncbi:MAG TPA: hypothetical protein VNS34_01030 [Rhizobiaceae bacterium]|nr:hypothetical protein [Rhizobiaceae bacterium]